MLLSTYYQLNKRSVAKIFYVALSGLKIELNLFIIIIVPLHIKTNKKSSTKLSKVKHLSDFKGRKL